MPESNGRLHDVLAACREREPRDLADLFRLIAQPSISAQDIGVRECADLFIDVLRGAGLRSAIGCTRRKTGNCSDGGSSAEARSRGNG
jgi:hypothetical protein